jgi:nucleoside recognition membrane protein YjiH
LCFKKDAYIDGTPQAKDPVSPPWDKSLLKYALEVALIKAHRAPRVIETLKEGIENAIEMVFTVLPVVMVIGTLALIVVEYTPFFLWIGQPFVPILEYLQIPEARQASQTIVVGFADMFIPAVLAATSIDSDVTRFVIAALSVTQIVYMSEVGSLLIGSKIPVNFIELFIIFILRTLVTLPVITAMAHCLL